MALLGMYATFPARLMSLVYRRPMCSTRPEISRRPDSSTRTTSLGENHPA
eukprot:CAMPEP_0198686460 /NCGR_PEP_ID=MMETSP1468-20131203/14927_1 /TAXON_ID=1461545 /ORGANISM="Mantoniella sp, Strain CCMP1436" /LENGTH=49 /DNA_ID= /DNA_START= /DNA_END= /DNA_ORIENTATION=